MMPAVWSRRAGCGVGIRRLRWHVVAGRPRGPDWAGPGGAPQVAGRRRMSLQRTSVGLDVHARSVAAAALDAVTGQVQRSRLCPEQAEIARWIAGLPGPVEVVYEAGPT